MRSSAHLMPLTSSIPPHVAMRTTAAPTRTRQQRLGMAAVAMFASVLLGGAAMTKTEHPSAAAGPRDVSTASARQSEPKRLEVERSTLLGRRAAAEPERAAPVVIPTAPITEAAATTVPIAIPTPQPTPRRHGRVQLVRDPGF
jgi:hypothetical protein